LTSASIEPLPKIMDWARATAWRSEQRGRLVFTNGVFDLLHPGHVDVLLAARHQGDALAVGLNSDASVRRLKGPTRPIRTLAERSYVLAALAMVDAVVSFEQDTPLELILHLHPDVVVKGGDYSVETVVGAREVRAWGGEVIIVPLTAGQSTTSIIERLRER
jgi:D-beta-D-heptose 7-phosphate kinase/D-beta-D-heptose 1-phosphate adenosyltransferase